MAHKNSCHESLNCSAADIVCVDFFFFFSFCEFSCEMSCKGLLSMTLRWKPVRLANVRPRLFSLALPPESKKYASKT